MSDLHSQPLVFDDLRVGQEWRSHARTVTEADIVHFAGLSGDFNPIHMDEEFARQTPYRTRIAHGLLGVALSSGLASHAPRVDTVAFVRIVEWNFLEPILPGDTIHVVSRIEALEPRARGRRGLVKWHRRIYNQTNKVVQEGWTETLVRGRALASSRPAGPSEGPDRDPA
jgi:acyl dehydratase